MESGIKLRPTGLEIHLKSLAGVRRSLQGLRDRQTAWHPGLQPAIERLREGASSDLCGTKLRTRKWLWIVRVAGVGAGRRGWQAEHLPELLIFGVAAL